LPKHLAWQSPSSARISPCGRKILRARRSDALRMTCGDFKQALMPIAKSLDNSILSYNRGRWQVYATKGLQCIVPVLRSAIINSIEVGSPSTRAGGFHDYPTCSPKSHTNFFCLHFVMPVDPESSLNTNSARQGSTRCCFASKLARTDELLSAGSWLTCHP
jgi:hypothetical protein